MSKPSLSTSDVYRLRSYPFSAAENEMVKLVQETKESLSRLQSLRGKVQQARRREPNPDWTDMDNALKKAEGPLTGAYRALKAF